MPSHAAQSYLELYFLLEKNVPTERLSDIINGHDVQ